nr:hypothetical protein [Streptomyces sp. NRRL B-24085]
MHGHHDDGTGCLPQHVPCHGAEFAVAAAAHDHQLGVRGPPDEGLGRRQVPYVLQDGHLGILRMPRPQGVGQQLHLVVLPRPPVLLGYAEGQFGRAGREPPRVDGAQAGAAR